MAELSVIVFLCWCWEGDREGKKLLNIQLDRCVKQSGGGHKVLHPDCCDAMYCMCTSVCVCVLCVCLCELD